MHLIDRKVASPQEMRLLARELAEHLRGALEAEKTVTVCLDGEMGVGKTALAAGVSAEFGVLRAKSPTYTVVNEYRGELPIFHFDFYRLADEDDLASIGFDDYLSRRALLLIEWSELLPGAIPLDAFHVRIERTDEATGRHVLLWRGESS